MDGTLYLGDTLLPGARALVWHLSENRLPFCLFTNNSSSSRQSYVEKLRRMGLELQENQILTSAYATMLWLSQKGIRSLFLMAVPEVEEEFRSSGFILDDASPEAVVLAFDKTLTYQKLCRAHQLLQDPSRVYVATHPDLVCPMPAGSIPDTGAMIALLQASTSRLPDVIGKPNRLMVSMAERLLDCTSDRMAIVGDRLYTDMKMGLDHGLTTVLLFSGETVPEDPGLLQMRPDLCFDNAQGLLQWMLTNEQ